MTIDVRCYDDRKFTYTLDDVQHIPYKDDLVVFNNIWYKVDGFVWNFDNSEHILYVVPNRDLI
jgi:hypothetical protein